MNLDYSTILVLAIAEMMLDGTQGVGCPGWTIRSFVLRMIGFYHWVPHVMAECAKEPGGTQLELNWRA